jgi:UDP-glucuronate 4-epimerase
MSILVTGGAGFIGSHLVKKLLKQNKKVICVDDFNSYYNPGYKRENIQEFLGNKNLVSSKIERLKLYKQDICDLEGLDKIFKENKIDTIVHLAARAGVRPSIENPLLYYQVNVMGTVNLLEMAKKYNVKNFVFASSSSVYGNNEKIPFSEDDRVDNPISPYAASKKSGELICHTYYDLYDINIACLRFFTVYGPKGRPDMAPYKFTELISRGEEIQMYGDGSTFRDYTYVDDIVSGVLASVEYIKKNNQVSSSDGGSRYEIFNLGNSKIVELKYLIETIEKEVGKKAKIKKMPIQAGDVDKTYADLSKSCKFLGYEPKINIEEGIKRFVKWYKINRIK